MGDSDEMGMVLNAIGKLETRLDDHTKSIDRMVDLIQGTNGHGLSTRVAVMEQHPGSCEVRTSVKWLTWAVRGIYAGIAAGFLWVIRQ